MLPIILSLLVIFAAGWFVLKKCMPQLILISAGIVLMALAVILDASTIVEAKQSTGFIWFDIFVMLRIIFSQQFANIGLIIMVVAAYAVYMEHIGASGALVSILIKPIQLLRSPYLVLIFSFFVGMHINIFVPSAAGLGLLLMTTLYPTLRKLGISPLAACAVMAMTGLELGPASGQSNFAAKTAGIDVALYFANYQLKIIYPVAAVVMILLAATHYFSGKKDAKQASSAAEDKSTPEEPENKAPLYYALLPVIPLALVLVFSPLVYSEVKLDIIPAVFISLFIAFFFELIRHRGIAGVKSYYHGFNFYMVQMGVAVGIVTIMIGGVVFAAGLKAIGAIDILIAFGKTAGFGPTGITIVMVCIIALVSALSGSGNAAFLAFAVLAPDIANGMGFDVFLLLIPMQLAAGMGRAMSPVAAVVIACAGIAGESPLDVARRNAIPMIGGLIAVIIFTPLIF